MKNLIGFIVKVLFFIPRLILSLIWSLVKAVVIVALLFWGITYFTNQQTSSVSDVFSTGIETLRQVLQGNGNQLANNVANNLSNLSVDNYSHTEGSRWETNAATVYLESTYPTLVSAYETAIANWNATGVFTFTMTTDKDQADIIATDYSDAQTQAAGLAESETNMLTNRLKHVDVKLNTYYLLNEEYGYDFDRIVHTAEHELGHAIGLDHDDAEVSVMQSAGSTYGIQETDLLAVQELYQ